MRRAVGGAGLLLLVLSLLYFVHGVRAGLSQVLYRSSHVLLVRGSGADIDTALARCETAYRIYPYSYHLCRWIASRAYALRRSPQGEEIPARIAAAKTWCDRGLMLNGRRRSLRVLAARLKARTSPEEALEDWNEYVKWDFWQPRNHAFTVDMAIAAGDLGRASEALRWVKGKHRKRAAERLRRAWQRERELPLARGRGPS
ncbi:MAG: hypothetical protein HQ559_18450 [Lentisphaerae bacterium]|nr:hypothetical protein [Lentisphaerota bacterium]